MDVLVAHDLPDALTALRDTPDARPLAGGTDLLVELRAAARRPPPIVWIAGLPELRRRERGPEHLHLGAAVTLTELAGDATAAAFPALAAAARSVGGPQIRNAATLGGNLATGGPASDLIPVLTVLGASALVEGPHGGREIPVGTSLGLRAAELVVGVRVPSRPVRQRYLRVGRRRGMAEPLSGVALAVDMDAHMVRCAVGGRGRVPGAERWIADQVDWAAGRITDPRSYEAFGRMAANEARPDGDRWAPAAYRRHAAAVLTRRALMELL